MRKGIALILTLVLLCGCTSTGQSSRQTIFCMDTVMDLQVWGDEEAVSALSRMLMQLEQTWSATAPDSLLCSGRTPTAEEQQVLTRSEALSARTGGAFDPKLGSLMEIWGFRTDAPHVPSREALSAALQDPKWDLGGALKGYAGTEAVRILRQYDVDRAILNLGGNIQTFGSKPDGSPWQIGIRDPKGDDSLGILSVHGTMAVVTSGDYQRYFEEDGIRYHHILDPETGYPADSGLSSVTVVCADGMTADALSTALFVMGLESGITFWHASDDFEAVFVLKDGSVYATEGAILSGCEFEVIHR